MGHLLKSCLSEVVKDCESKSYYYWKELKFPISYDKDFREKTIQVEIDVLEETKDYLHIIISVDSGFFSSLFPKTSSIIVKKL